MSTQRTMYTVMLLVMFGLVWAPAALARSSIRIEVGQPYAVVGEPLDVTVEISTDGQGGYDQYQPPTFAGFRQLAGGMSSQQIEMINWQVRRRESHVYQLLPMQHGRTTIGPASILVEGRMYRSNVVSLEVKPQGSSSGAAAAPPANQLNDSLAGGPVNEPPPSTNEILPDRRDWPPIFLSASTEKKKVYVGQQVLVVWQVFTQTDILGYQPTKQPVFDHVWVEDLPSPRRLDLQQQTVSGRQYYAAVLMKKALFPRRAGTVTITPLHAQLRTAQGFFASVSSYRSDEITLEVMPLPEKGKPPQFPDANVGQYTMTATIDRNQVAAGDAVTLKLVIVGRGNVRQVVAPAITALPGFKIYEPKISDQLDATDRVSGSKQVEYLLLPTARGTQQIPPLTLHYFNPETERYETSQTTALSLTVVGDPAALTRAPSGEVKGNASTTGVKQDIRPPRPVSELKDLSPQRTQIAQTVLLGLPPVLAYLALLWSKKRRGPRPSRKAVYRALERRVHQHLVRAAATQNQPTTASTTTTFYSEVAAALREPLQQLVGPQTRIDGLTNEQLIQTLNQVKLTDPKITDELVSDISALLQQCDLGRFTKSGADPSQQQQLLNKGRQVIDQLLRALMIVVLALLCGGNFSAKPAHAQPHLDDATTTTAYQHALRAYYGGRYKDAQRIFEQVLAQPVRDPSLLYNLGCAHFRQNQYGPAIYYFEQAAQLDSDAEDIQHNLTIARQLASAQENKAEVLKDVGSSRWWMRAAAALRSQTWIQTSLILWWLLWLSLIGIRYLAPSGLRAAIVTVNVFVAIAFFTTTALGALRLYDEQDVRYGIVLPSAAAVREGPADATRVLFKLPAGTKVRVTTPLLEGKEQDFSAASWQRIRLPNGLEGWIVGSAVGLL